MVNQSAKKTTKSLWSSSLCKYDRELLELMETDWPGASDFIDRACVRYARLHPSCAPEELTRAARAAIDGYRKARARRAGDRARLRAFAAALADALEMDIDPVIPDSLHILRNHGAEKVTESAGTDGA